MDQPFLTGHFEQTLDDKSRLLVPASLRRKINPAVHGEQYYLVITPERRLWMYPDKYFEFLFTRDMEADAIPQRDIVAFDRLTLGMAVEIEADKSGRIVIPEQSRKRVRLGKSVMMVGNRDHIEIWDLEDWMTESEKLLDRGEELSDRARMARRGEGISLKTQTITGYPG